MSFRRQLRGVLEVVTLSGTHCLDPSLLERLQLVWIFRNFRQLPLDVLSGPQRRIFRNISEKYRSAHPHRRDELLGTLDCLPTTKKPVRSKSNQAYPKSAKNDQEATASIFS
jgi:hypothetical protein